MNIIYMNDRYMYTINLAGMNSSYIKYKSCALHFDSNSQLYQCNNYLASRLTRKYIPSGHSVMQDKITMPIIYTLA